MFNPTKCIEDSARTGCKTNGSSRERQRLGSRVVAYCKGESQVVQRDDIRRLHIQNAPVPGYGSVVLACLLLELRKADHEAYCSWRQPERLFQRSSGTNSIVALQ